MTLMQAIPARTRSVRRLTNGPVRDPLGAPAGRDRTVPPRRPGPSRPAGAPLRYRASGVAISTTAHRKRPVTAATTMGLAVLAGLITLWLGLMAHLGDMVNGSAADLSGRVPDRLAVVRVAAGESLQDIAARVAPDAPLRQVVDRIRELNDLDASMPAAGQTLIAPVG